MVIEKASPMSAAPPTPGWTRRNFSAAAAQDTSAAEAPTPAFTVKTKRKYDMSLWPTHTVPFGLKDVLDVVNPLQHIPGISDLYQTLTGDRPSKMAQVLGGFMYGGISGGLLAHAETLYESATNETPAASIKNALLNKKDEALAAAATPPVETTAAPISAATPKTFINALPGNAAALVQASPSQLAGLVRDYTTASGSAAAAVSVPDAMANALDKYRAAAQLRTVE